MNDILHGLVHLNIWSSVYSSKQTVNTIPFRYSKGNENTEILSECADFKMKKEEGIAEIADVSEGAKVAEVTEFTEDEISNQKRKWSISFQLDPQMNETTNEDAGKYIAGKIESDRVIKAQTSAPSVSDVTQSSKTNDDKSDKKFSSHSSFSSSSGGNLATNNRGRGKDSYSIDEFIKDVNHLDNASKIILTPPTKAEKLEKGNEDNYHSNDDPDSPIVRIRSPNNKDYTETTVAKSIVKKVVSDNSDIDSTRQSPVRSSRSVATRNFDQDTISYHQSHSAGILDRDDEKEGVKRQETSCLLKAESWQVKDSWQAFMDQRQEDHDEDNFKGHNPTGDKTFKYASYSGPQPVDEDATNFSTTSEYHQYGHQEPSYTPHEPSYHYRQEQPSLHLPRDNIQGVQQLPRTAARPLQFSHETFDLHENMPAHPSWQNHPSRHRNTTEERSARQSIHLGSMPYSNQEYHDQYHHSDHPYPPPTLHSAHYHQNDDSLSRSSYHPYTGIPRNRPDVRETSGKGGDTYQNFHNKKNEDFGSSRHTTQAHRHSLEQSRYEDHSRLTVHRRRSGSVSTVMVGDFPKNSSHEYQRNSEDGHLQPYYNRQIISLSTNGDEQWLSEFLCFVRSQCIEVFTASPDDVAARVNSKKVLLGQVGIRCRFCAHQPHRDRAGRSSSFPSSINRIYQSLTMMLRDHFTKCHSMPKQIKERYLYLKANTNQGATDSKKYWLESAHELGLMDTDAGIRFWHLPDPEAPLDYFPAKHPCNS